MLIVAMGPPSAFTRWGLHILRAVADAALGAYDVATVNRVDELHDAWRSRRTEHFLAFIDIPEARIAKTLQRTRARVVAFLEDPVDVVGYVMAERAAGWRDALRTTASCLAAMHDVYLMPSTRVVRRAAGLCARDVLFAVANHLGLELTEAQLRAAFARLHAGADEAVEAQILRHVGHARPIGASPAGISAQDLGALEAACAPFRSLLESRPVESVPWPRQLFIGGEGEYGEPAARVDMTGPARFLFAGPYLHLPRGDWAAELIFSVDGNRSGNAAILDVHSGGLLARGTAALPPRGDFRIELPFRVREPARPIELRLQIAEGAIEGGFRFRAATMRRRGAGGHAPHALTSAQTLQSG